MLNCKLLAGCVLAASMHILLSVHLQGRSVHILSRLCCKTGQSCTSLSTDAIVHPMHICAWQTWLHAFPQHAWAWACADSSDHDS